MDSKNVTDTSSRLLQGMNNIINDAYKKQNIEAKIEDKVQENMVTTGVITKFYPYLNKCEVRLDMTGEKVLCKIGSLFGGDLLFLYTPVGDEDYCEELHEPCIIPRSTLYVCLVNIHSDDDEYLMLNYYFPEELVGLNPSAMGNFKIIAVGGVKEYSIKFGIDGLNVTNNGAIELTELDDLEGDVTTEYYTKEDMDSIIKNVNDSINDLKLNVLKNIDNHLIYYSSNTMVRMGYVPSDITSITDYLISELNYELVNGEYYLIIDNDLIGDAIDDSSVKASRLCVFIDEEHNEVLGISSLMLVN